MVKPLVRKNPSSAEDKAPLAEFHEAITRSAKSYNETHESIVFIMLKQEIHRLIIFVAQLWTI